MEIANSSPHIPVMPEAVLHWLAVSPDGVFIDCTLGAGGHARMIATCLTENGCLLGLDRDPLALTMAREKLKSFSNVRFVHANYSELEQVTRETNWPKADGILIDAGVSSMQLDQPDRGFSFQTSGPLDMRMDTTSSITAKSWLSQQNEDSLATTLRLFGDVGPARRIAASIIRKRDQQQLNTTDDLVTAICDALNFVHGEPDEIRTVFQAVRMAVNEELQGLEKGLQAAIQTLKPGGRLVVLTFHSGEDRVVKNTLRNASRAEKLLRPDGRLLSVKPALVRLLTKKPVLPDAKEIFHNSRSKSAKLRAVERLAV